MIEVKDWRELPIGGIIVDAGNAVENPTGGWRVLKPVLTPEKCVGCMFCWLYCPDHVIFVVEAEIKGKKKRIVDFNMEHCKGCGVCANVCPTKAIDMVEEEK